MLQNVNEIPEKIDHAKIKQQSERVYFEGILYIHALHVAQIIRNLKKIAGKNIFVQTAVLFFHTVGRKPSSCLTPS